MDKVIIRRYKQAPREVIAFLHDVPANLGSIMSYEHIGQHGEASMGFYLGATVPVNETDADAKALIAELRRIGYEPEIYRRLGRKQA